ncbi:MAG TPA: MBL fold metallo-hydrolase [Chloroflexota bacterium]
MYFKQILDERCGCASYVVASRSSLEAAVVDPAMNIEPYEVLLRERHFRLRYVIDTHVHADHVSGGRALAAAFGAELCLHESAQVAYQFRPLHDGEDLELGQLRLHIVHTPGHRPELISILIVNPPRSPEPSMVLTGDSLLVGDVGRPDFGGGDASQQYDSITRLLRLPDWVGVFPGHFEGPCGKGMCGRPSTTIGFERLYNPLARMEREPFLAAMTAEVPARPLNMTAIESTNRGVADQSFAMLANDEERQLIDIPSLEAALDEVMVLDVREPSEYAAGHIANSTNLPQAELASSLDLIPRDHRIVVICQAGYRSRRAAQFLQAMGFEQAASAEGGMDAWLAAGKPIRRGEMDTGAPRIKESEWAHAGGSSA